MNIIIFICKKAIYVGELVDSYLKVNEFQTEAAWVFLCHSFKQKCPVLYDVKMNKCIVSILRHFKQSQAHALLPLKCLNAMEINTKEMTIKKTSPAS